MKKKKLTKDVKKPTKYLICTLDIDKSKVKAAGDSLIIEGYANTVDKDRVGDVVLPEAFTKTLPGYMENPVLLFQHDWDKVIGNVTSAEVTDKGLYIRAKVSGAKDVEDTRTKILEGSLRTFSIGYNEVDAVFDERTKTNVIKELELLEISVVTIPANAQAKFSVVQNEKGQDDVEKTLETLPEEFVKFFAETLADLDDDQVIDIDFIKNVFEIWKEMGLETEAEAEATSTKSYSQPEQDHLDKVADSAMDAATKCMKELMKAHGEHMKSGNCEGHMKAMDAYCRAMDEHARAKKAAKLSKQDEETKEADQDDTVEWQSYSRRGSADEGYAEDEGKKDKEPKTPAEGDKKPKEDEGKKD